MPTVAAAPPVIVADAAALRLAGADRVLVAPLTAGGRAWGALVAIPRPGAPVDLATLHLFALQLAAAIAAAETLELVERRDRQLAAIHAIASASLETDLDALIPEVLRIAAVATDSDRAAMWLFDAEGTLSFAGVHGYAGRFVDDCRRLPPDGPNAEVARTLRPIAANVAREWPPHLRDAAVAEGFIESALLPLPIQGKAAGTLDLARTTARPYTPEELESAALLTEQIALHIEASRLHGAQRKRAQALALINEVGALINERLDLPSVLDTGIRHLARAADVPRAFLMLLSADGQTLSTAAVAHEGPAERVTLRMDEPSAAGASIRQLRPLIIHDVDTDPRANIVVARRLGHRALMACPLISGGKALGAVVLAETRAPRHFSEEEVDRAVALANQLATAIANSRLFEDLKESYGRLERAQAELIERERLAALGELAALVAHEVRNPVAVIFNSLGSLRRQLPADGDIGFLLGVIQEEAERLDAMVGDFLDYARPNAPQLRLEPIEGVLQAAAEAAVGAHEGTRVRVAVEGAAGLPAVPLDGPLLRQAFINLISNAIEARPRSARVMVAAAVEGEADRRQLRVEVTDDGPGIPRPVQERLFQPFVTTKANGTGLGLAVVKRIIEAHRGEISARSDGRGTCFTVRLPIDDAG